MTAVTSRQTVVLSTPVYWLFKIHDAGVILQFLFMIPVVIALYNRSHQGLAGMSRARLATGIGALSATALILVLVFPKFLPDGYYIISQGVFGAWLMVVCWRMQGVPSGSLRWFGMVVSFGLAVLGTIP